MTDVNIKLKVTDNVTKESQRIIGRMADALKRAATATKNFFSGFDARAFEVPLKGLKGLWEGFNKLGAKLNEFAPDAKKVTAQFGPETLKRLTEAAESFNRLGAALNQWLGTLIASIPGLSGLMDDLAQRMKNAAGIGAALTDRAALQVAIIDAENEFANSVFRERGEYERLTKAIQDAKAALVAYDTAQAEKARNEARAREARDIADEKRIRAQNEARGVKELTGLDKYGRKPDSYQADKDLADLRRMVLAADAEFVDKMLSDWIESNDEKLNDSREMFLAMSDEQRDFIDASNRLREYDSEDEAKNNAERIAAYEATLAKQLEAFIRYRNDQDALELEALENQRQAAERMQAQIENVSGIITDRFMGAFDAIISGTDNVARAFTRMIGQILADVGRMMAAEAMRKWLTSVLGSLVGSTEETVQGLSTAEANLIGQASGGFVGGRNAFMVGERGPELFVPSTSGNIITAGRTAQTVGGGIGNVSITVSGAQDPVRTATEVKRALMGLLANDVGTRQRLRVVASGGGVA